MAAANFIKNIAIVGASGNSGTYLVNSLLSTGKHNITAITRADGNSKFPDGVNVRKVNYDQPPTIKDALQEQDALIITLSPTAPRDQQDKLIEAAAEAGVSWVMPNDWNTDHPAMVKDIMGYGDRPRIRNKINELGMNYVCVACGFWYEWSLSIPDAFGINIPKREATLFDDGEIKICSTTWPQLGRAVAALFSLPIKPEGGDNDRCLEHFKNKHAYVSSFTVSQKDMLDSVMRVTGTKSTEWTIKTEPAEERYKNGVEAMKNGDLLGFIRHMYTRVFFSDEVGNHEKWHGTVNQLLGLPKEDFDEATKIAVERQQESGRK